MKILVPNGASDRITVKKIIERVVLPKMFWPINYSLALDLDEEI